MTPRTDAVQAPPRNHLAENLMTDAATEIETEASGPIPLPECTQAALRAMLDAGGVAFIDDEDRIVAGTREQPGQTLPTNASEMLGITCRMLIAGERERLLLTRRGRHYARYGSLANFDDSVTDVDLAAWGRGEIDYLEQELLEAVDTFHHEIALNREEALAILMKRGVVTRAEARTDIEESE
jgi:hypothetical protein